MQHHRIKNMLSNRALVWVVFFVFLGLVVFLFFQTYTLKNNVITLRTELASTTALLSKNTDELSQHIAELRAQASGLSSTLSYAQQNIDAVKNQVGGVEQTLGSVSGTVGTLQKLSNIDQELLRKYSKVYFMNENYVPLHLTPLPKEYAYSDKRTEQFLTEAWPFLKLLLDNAKAGGINIYVKSGYRSFGEQQTLKSTYSVVYGAGTANSFSADQGYSEHQLGTTVDFITSGLNGQLEGFEKTPAYQWLVNNAHRYGFSLSYPKNNSHYVFEPWHWRFVGVKLATYLHDNNLQFYDVDQREIDKYLVNIFD